MGHGVEFAACSEEGEFRGREITAEHTGIVRIRLHETEGPHGWRACAPLKVGATEAKTLDQDFRSRNLCQGRRGWARVELHKIEIPGCRCCRKLFEIAELPAQQADRKY